MIAYAREFPGKAHSLNEDSHFEWEFKDNQERLWGLYLVADGLSGHAGTIASHLAVHTIVHAVEEGLRIENSDPGKLLQQAIIEANLKLRERGTTYTTLDVVLVSEGEHLYLAHLGDSRIYFVYPDRVEQMTKDEITPRGGPANYLGAGKPEGSDLTIEHRLNFAAPLDAGRPRPQGIYLETDGVGDRITPQQRQEILLKYAFSNPKRALDEIAAATARSWKKTSDRDDMTMVYADLEDVVERQLSKAQQLNQNLGHVTTEMEKYQLELQGAKTTLLEKAPLEEEIRQLKENRDMLKREMEMRQKEQEGLQEDNDALHQALDERSKWRGKIGEIINKVKPRCRQLIDDIGDVYKDIRGNSDE